MNKIILRKDKQVTLDGLMTLGKLQNGLHTADFTCCEDIEMEAFSGKFRVQGMRDGNLYMSELPKRKRGKPLFRDDNCSLSLGQNGKWYFSFSLDASQQDLLPEKLIHQARAIAQKVLCEIINGKKTV